MEQDEEGRHKLADADVGAVKREIIGLMIKVPYSLQVQLGEAISIIADSDFWERWDTLVDVCRKYINCFETTTYKYLNLGPCFSPDSRQHRGQQRGLASCSLNLQEMEATLSVRRTLYGNKPRAGTILYTIPDAVIGTWELGLPIFIN